MSCESRQDLSMASSFFTSSRKRASALTIAFGVLASGAVLTAAPAFAATTTPAPTPVETAPATTEPATPAETTPAETTPVETTPAETTPVETTPAETTPAETATPTATEEAAVPAGMATKPSFTQGEPITYVLSGFEPGKTITSVTLTLPDGSVVAVPSVDGADFTVLEDGTFAGEITSTGPAPVGDYSVTVTQDFTDAASQPSQNTATFGFNIAAPATTTPTPTTDPTPTVEAPVAYANAGSFLPTDDISYTAENFTPGLDLEVTVVYPDGESVVAEGNDETVVAEDGTYMGLLINKSGAPLALGEYTVHLSQSSGLSASFTFLVAEATPGTTTTPSSTAAPAGNGGTNSGTKSPELATTGAEDVFGAAGIGLLALATGAGVLVARRLATKKA